MIVTFPKGINGYNSHSICSTFTDSMLINFSSGSDLFHSAFLFSIVFNSIYFTSCPSGQVSDEQIIGNCRILQSVIYLICEDGISVNLIIRELAQIFCLGFFFLSVSSHSSTPYTNLLVGIMIISNLLPSSNSRRIA